MTPGDERRRVVVAMLTFRRPEFLAGALPALAGQAGDVEPRAVVVVVDNDPDGGAERSVAEWRDQGVHYRHEPRPGIAVARNRALGFAEDLGADALVFIDDDELPDPGWLAALVRTWREEGCAAVSGPVRSTFDTRPSPWVAATGVYERKRFRPGQSLRSAATNNLLLDLATLQRYALRFDERLSLIGGEDTLLTHELVRRGETILWCDEAEVSEPIPNDRATWGWVLRRGFRAGTSWSFKEITVASGLKARMITRCSLAVRAVTHLIVAASHILVGSVRADRGRVARAVFAAASRSGMLLGAFGYTYPEYRRRRDSGMLRTDRPAGRRSR